jgi:hypothetical protein
VAEWSGGSRCASSGSPPEKHGEVKGRGHGGFCDSLTAAAGQRLRLLEEVRRKDDRSKSLGPSVGLPAHNPERPLEGWGVETSFDPQINHSPAKWMAGSGKYIAELRPLYLYSAHWVPFERLNSYNRAGWPSFCGEACTR